MNKILPIVLLLLSICLSANAQNVISGSKVLNRSGNPVLDKLLSSYEIYEIDIKKGQFNLNATSTAITLELGEVDFDMNLFENNVTVMNTMEDLPMLMGGSLNNGGTVSLTINDDFIYGFIKQNNQQLFIEPLSYLDSDGAKGLYVVYDVHAVKEDTEHVCGVTETSKKEKEFAPLRTITTCKVIELAIANTYNMVTKYTNAAGAQNHNLAVLNNVQTNYRSEFDSNVEFEVVAHFFPTSTSNNPLTPNTTTTDASVLLGNFRSWAQGPGNAGGGNTGGATGSFGIDYTMASLWTDRNISFGGSSGTVGLAYTPGWHHVLEDYTASAPSLMSMVTHEKGHNFDADHDASGSSFIMAPSVTITETWSPASKSSINNRLASQTYLDNCSTLGAPTASINQSAYALCTGSSVEFEEQSQYGATRDWEFFNGTPTTSTEEKETVTYNTTGLHAIKLTSHNATGSDVAFGYVDVQSAPPSACTPSGAGAAAITNVTLSNLFNATTGTAVYEDYSCSHVATVQPNTSYNLVVGVNGVTRIRYFVDYNDDGDFSDSGENSPMYTFSGNGNLGLTLATPASMVTGELLRFRIAVSTGSIGADGCSNPTSGQVEDYSFYVEETQVFGCTDPTSSNYNSSATIDDGSCNTAGTMVTWYRDLDNDTYGNPNNTTQAVNQPSGYVSNNTDCNDNNASINPSATEVCDGLDNNCNGLTDEGVTSTFYVDNDNDGYGGTSSTQACSAPSGYVSNNLDCNDNNASINPGATEICDGQDNNCNGQTDENGTTTFYFDNDNDGYGGTSSIQTCSPPSGYVSNNSDCNDNNANINPGATEICDGIDNDCDGLIDENVTTTFYFDNDNDGYGSNTSTQACSAPSGYVSNNSDCNDNNANINPGAAEICDGVDNNCNGVTDEGCSTGGTNTCHGTALVINAITQNTFRANISIESTATVNSASDILFTAGQTIELKPGFEVVLGTDFEARIEPCTTFAPSPNPASNSNLGDLNDRVENSFDKNLSITASIINGQGEIRKRQQIMSHQLLDFVNKAPLDLEKGMYQLLLEQDGKEINQEMFIIK